MIDRRVPGRARRSPSLSPRSVARHHRGRRAARIAEQNARFNLGREFVQRTVNVPTFALLIMHPRFRDRVKVRHTGADVLEGRPGWLIEFREQNRRTLVRTPDGGNQPSRVVALVDAQTGDVLRTVLTWERVKGSIAVSYSDAPGIPLPVPIRMAEGPLTRRAAPLPRGPRAARAPRPSSQAEAGCGSGTRPGSRRRPTGDSRKRVRAGVLLRDGRHCRRSGRRLA